MADRATRWLRVAVEQYDELSVASQTSIDNALAQIEEDSAARPDDVPYPDGTWSIPVAGPADVLVARTVVIDQRLVVLRILS